MFANGTSSYEKAARAFALAAFGCRFGQSMAQIGGTGPAPKGQ